MTAPEARLLNNKKMFYTGRDYFLLSPSGLDSTSGDSAVRTISSIGNISTGTTSSSLGVRPVISLKAGTEYSFGDGSKDNPYVVLRDD